tara:strand:+ start:389 stop:1000 length:612 start_codon:yes stop_codon:yes gene_type:complete
MVEDVAMARQTVTTRRTRDGVDADMELRMAYATRSTVVTISAGGIFGGAGPMITPGFGAIEMRDTDWARLTVPRNGVTGLEGRTLRICGACDGGREHKGGIGVFPDIGSLIDRLFNIRCVFRVPGACILRKDGYTLAFLADLIDTACATAGSATTVTTFLTGTIGDTDTLSIQTLFRATTSAAFTTTAIRPTREPCALGCARA